MASEWPFIPILTAAGIIFSSGYVLASDREIAVNDSFFDGAPVAPDAQILLVSIDTKVLPHGDSDAVLIPYSSPDGRRLPDACHFVSADTKTFTLDCGAHLLAVETEEEETIYYVLSRARKGDWYQLVLNPQKGNTSWIKDPDSNGLKISQHSLLDWVLSEDSFDVAHDIEGSVQILKKPDDASETLTDCEGYLDGDGLIPVDKARDGDWMRVACLEDGCFASNDPERTCNPTLNLQGSRCVQGWARWRAKNGRLQLYPHQALPDGC